MLTASPLPRTKAGATPQPESLPVATFTVDHDGQLTPSADLIVLLGAPDDGESALGWLLEHVAEEERDAVGAALQLAASGHRIARWVTLTDARARVRSLLMLAGTKPAAGSATPDSGGATCQLVDLTESLRSRQEKLATTAVAQAAATRSVIDQAKGMIRLILDVNDEEAFQLLRWHSSNTNIKLHTVATTLVEGLVQSSRVRLSPRQRLAAVLAEMGGKPMPATLIPDASRRQLREQDAARIDPDDLTRLMVRAVGGAGQSIAIGDASIPGAPLIYVNDAFAALTGYSADEILGRTCTFLQGPETDYSAIQQLGRAIWNGVPDRVVIKNYRKDGTNFWNEVDVSPVVDETGKVSHIIGYQSDVTDRVEREQLMFQLAYCDASTGLPNLAWARKHLVEDPALQRVTLRMIRITGVHGDGIDDDQAPGKSSELVTQIDRDLGALAQYLLKSGSEWVARIDTATLLIAPSEPSALDASTTTIEMDGTTFEVDVAVGAFAELLAIPAATAAVAAVLS